MRSDKVWMLKLSSKNPPRSQNNFKPQIIVIPAPRQRPPRPLIARHRQTSTTRSWWLLEAHVCISGSVGDMTLLCFLPDTRDKLATYWSARSMLLLLCFRHDFPGRGGHKLLQTHCQNPHNYSSNCPQISATSSNGNSDPRYLDPPIRKPPSSSRSYVPLSPRFVPPDNISIG